MSCPNLSCGRRHQARQADLLGWTGAHWLWPLAGVAGLIWFLIRVVPRPSRAAYPCQRVAMPLAGGLVIWLAGALGSALAWRRARRLLGQARFGLAGLFLIGAAGMGAVLLVAPPERMIRAADQLPNDPIGTARGTHPGRVVWVHDRDATDWGGPGDGHWWQPEHTDQTVVDQMMSTAVRRLAGAASDAAAWDAFFHYFNQAHGKGDIGYVPGEKITVKVNLVGCHYREGWGGVDSETYDMVSLIDYMNTSPQMMLALLRQLVLAAGVAPGDIAIGDPTALFPNQYYDYLHGEFPQVRYLDHLGGNTEHPRTMVQYSDVVFFWSSHPTGVIPDHVPVSFVEAEYLINLANFKSHSGAGVTLCGKNHYGSLIRYPSEAGFYDMHPSLPSLTPLSGSYRALVDLMGHAHVGGKTLLYLVDGLYSGVHPEDSSPRRWDFAPFGGDWTSSLFAAQDPLAIDSVCFDFMQEEGDPRLFPQRAGTDDYLHEAAWADNPPSGTFYDPDHADNVAHLTSLGVHEHWNNPQQMQYSRDLGTGDGIELIKIGTPTAVADGGALPARLTRVHPNPFNAAAVITLDLPARQDVDLTVFGADGRRMRTLVRGILPRGNSEIRWDGRDAGGRPVASGVYFYRLQTGTVTETGRMVVLK